MCTSWSCSELRSRSPSEPAGIIHLSTPTLRVVLVSWLACHFCNISGGPSEIQSRRPLVPLDWWLRPNGIRDSGSERGGAARRYSGFSFVTATRTPGGWATTRARFHGGMDRLTRWPSGQGRIPREESGAVPLDRRGGGSPPTGCGSAGAGRAWAPHCACRGGAEPQPWGAGWHEIGGHRPGRRGRGRPPRAKQEKAAPPAPVPPTLPPIPALREGEGVVALCGSQEPRTHLSPVPQPQTSVQAESSGLKCSRDRVPRAATQAAGGPAWTFGLRIPLARHQADAQLEGLTANQEFTEGVISHPVSS
ncbi:uncharacterized protein LOC141573718 [Camelus bactrianus]|uniref:Uncharacterized protein LOC141573718 n=1 Tax=Camelus bactrianus TaxID=9837 RepID=A0AC58NR11_CAMBA